MNVRRLIQTIDTHTGGQPTRNVISGFPIVEGKTMLEKMHYMIDHHDDLRKLLVNEPRGNEIMSCTLTTPACSDNADIGVLFFEVGYWMPMCGHDTIGVVTALIESGVVKSVEPVTKLTLDTAAGLVQVEASVVDGVVQGVSFTNAPAFVMATDIKISLEPYGELSVDIAYGGNVYAILPAASVGLDIDPNTASQLIEIGNRVKEKINSTVQISHPEIDFIDEVTHVEFSGPPKSKEATLQNAVVIPPGAIDRSPCGTGTSAKMALLHKNGELRIGESFVHESIINSLFHCEIVRETSVAGIPAVVPKISGRAWITGMHTFCVAADDPFPSGFVLG